MKCLGIHLSCIESEYLEIDLGQTSFNAETKKKKTFEAFTLLGPLQGKLKVFHHSRRDPKSSKVCNRMPTCPVFLSLGCRTLSRASFEGPDSVPSQRLII